MTLDEDDRVTVTFRGQVIELRASSSYSATIDPVPEVAADEDVTFSVDRHDGDEAPSSSVKTTAPIGLDPYPLFVSRSKDFTLTWTTPTDDEMTWTVAGCVRSNGRTIEPRATSLTIAKNTFDTAAASGTCTAVLAINRGRVAPVDPSFGWGDVVYVERIVFEFASTP